MNLSISMNVSGLTEEEIAAALAQTAVMVARCEEGGGSGPVIVDGVIVGNWTATR